MISSARLLGLILGGLVTLGSAQDLSVPNSWREYSKSRPLPERTNISQNAIHEMLTQYTSSNGQFNGIGFWQAANAWSAMANHDRLAGTTVYQAHVTDGLNTAFELYTNYDQFGWWATAAVYAHRAYGDSNLLAHAIATWQHVTSYVITPNVASAGNTSVKTFTLQATCDGVTMAGGVFWRPTLDDQSINSITTGLYVTLSAFLAEITGDSVYTTAAINSANWIKNLNLASNNIVLDSVNAHDCSRSPATWLFTYNSGKFIEGLMVLGAVTDDNQWKDFLLKGLKIIAAAVKFSGWEGANGVITEGSSPDSNNDGVGFKAVFIRGLHEAWERHPEYTDLRYLLQSYINVQNNALLELAANGDTYSSSWLGPPQGFTSWGQLAALDVFVSTIDITMLTC